MNDQDIVTWKDKFFSEKTSLILTITSLVVMAVAGFTFIVLGDWSFSWKINEEKIAQFGDFIGGVVGTLLAFVAAILYYVALKAQRRDIAINQSSMTLQTEALQKQIEEFEKQKEELELTRKVYEQQSKTMADQERIMKIQQFESNFYSLLNVYISIKNNLNIYSEDKDFFKSKHLELLSLCTIKIGQPPYECHELIVKSYEVLFHRNQGQLAHYFKTVYRLLKTIDSNVTLSESEKYDYAKILRSQLTDYESIIMYYNYHSVYGEKSRILIYKYNLLKHVHTIDKIDYALKYNIKSSKTDFIPFYNFVIKFIEQGINKICNLEFIEETIEDRFAPFNIIISILNTDIPEIKISFLDKTLCDHNSKDMYYDLIYDQVYLSQFSLIKDGIKDSTEFEDENGNTVFSYKLNIERIKSINTDKY